MPSRKSYGNLLCSAQIKEILADPDNIIGFERLGTEIITHVKADSFDNAGQHRSAFYTDFGCAVAAQTMVERMQSSLKDWIFDQNASGSLPGMNLGG